MATLGELAKLIRSKNAGPFHLTFDVMFDEEAVYRRVVDANVLTKEAFCRIYNLEEEKVLLVCHDAARAIKISIPRPVSSCDLEDGDCYGGQQFGPLVNLEIPEIS